MLKGKQKKLDKNNNGRIDGEDFKLLRADKPMKAMTGKAVNRREETRKKQNPHSEYDKKGKLKYTAAKMGRSIRGYGAARTSGTGLMDEQMAPGKVIKASMGEATDYKKYLKGLKKATDSVKKDKEKKFFKRRIKLMGMPKLSKGDLYSSKDGKKFMSKEEIAQEGKRIQASGKATFESIKDKNAPMKRERLADRVASRKKKVAGRMGGGMMNKPMGYTSGGDTKKPKPQKKAKNKYNDGPVLKPDADILLNRYNKKFSKYEGSKEAELHSGYKNDPRPFPDIGEDRASKRATKEVLQEAGIKFRTGGSIMAKGCKLGRKKKTKLY